MRVQMRAFYMGYWGVQNQYRVCQENGWGGRWCSTVYLAWVDWRRASLVAGA